MSAAYINTELASPPDFVCTTESVDKNKTVGSISQYAVCTARIRILNTNGYKPARNISTTMKDKIAAAKQCYKIIEKFAKGTYAKHYMLEAASQQWQRAAIQICMCHHLAYIYSVLNV